MKILNVKHKGLRRLIEAGEPGGLPAAVVEKVRDIITFLQDMASEEELHGLPAWKPHQMSGDRKGLWALHVTRNWRITFRIDRDRLEISDLNYEDYH